MVSNDVLCACPANPQAENREAYDYWKQNLKRSGKQPLEMVEHFRECGMNDYADSLEQFIQEMEGEEDAVVADTLQHPFDDTVVRSSVGVTKQEL